MTAPTTPERPSEPPMTAAGVPPQPSSPPVMPGPQPPARGRIDLQGWGSMITALVGVATLCAGFAGGFFTQSQVTGADDARPRPTVTVTLPGPTVTVTAATPAAGVGGTGSTTGTAAGSAVTPSVNALPGGLTSSPSPSAVRVLTAAPDGGRGGTRTVLTGRGFPAGQVVRVSFVVKGDLGEDMRVRDLRDTVADAGGSFAVEVVIPSDLGTETNRNCYLRARTTSDSRTETVFDLSA